VLAYVLDEALDQGGFFRVERGFVLAQCGRGISGTFRQRLDHARFGRVSGFRQLVCTAVGFAALRSVGDVLIPERHVPYGITKGADACERCSFVLLFGKLPSEVGQLCVDLFPALSEHVRNCLTFGSFGCHTDFVRRKRREFLAKIALARDGGGGGLQTRTIARGDGWSVAEVTCTLGPKDRPFEESHRTASVAIVTAGTFQYCSRGGRELMTPGSLMLVGSEQLFECRHEHGSGDRCISFSYSPKFLDRLDAGPVFRGMRIPPVRSMAPLLARASAAFAGDVSTSWEELGIELAASAAQMDRGLSRGSDNAGPGATERVSRVVRMMEDEPDDAHELSELARQARLSLYHFLRIFQKVAGVTPHQYLLRRRLHHAAVRLRTKPAKVVDIALESGFGDISNFNRTFRAEFGVSPRTWRGGGWIS
jgi:AraC family transcriptional regulator